ncbi:putative transcriptional regulator [Lachnospiraceae bacterium PF1-22]
MNKTYDIGRCYYTVFGWMLDIGLKGNELLTFAIIYGFSQGSDEDQKFNGSLGYLAAFLGIKRPGVSKCLSKLVEKGYIEKQVIYISNVRTCAYKAKPFNTLKSMIDSNNKEVLLRKKRGVTQENFYVVQGWMLDLGLKGTDIQLYAIIYGFSQNNEEDQFFLGSLSYLSAWTNLERTSVRKNLADMVSKGILEKHDDYLRSEKRCYYRAISKNDFLRKNDEVYIDDIMQEAL